MKPRLPELVASLTGDAGHYRAELTATARPMILWIFLASMVGFYAHAVFEVFVLEIVRDGPIWHWALPAVGFGLALAGAHPRAGPNWQDLTVIALIGILAFYGLLYAQRSGDPIARAAQGQLLLAVYALLVTPTFPTLLAALTIQFSIGLMIEELHAGPNVFGRDGIPTAIMGGLVVILLGVVLEAMRRQIFVTMMQMRRRSETDPLTGLLNRRALESAVAQVETDRDRARDFLLLVDLDGFKAVNDSRGHAAGDRVLQQVSEAMRGVVRDHDHVARLGGDEFLIWLHDLTQRQAEAIAARLLDAVRERGLPVGMSIGIAAVKGSVQEAIRTADAAMYRAKQRGGHQLVTAETAMLVAGA